MKDEVKEVINKVVEFIKNLEAEALDVILEAGGVISLAIEIPSENDGTTTTERIVYDGLSGVSDVEFGAIDLTEEEIPTDDDGEVVKREFTDDDGDFLRTLRIKP